MRRVCPVNLAAPTGGKFSVPNTKTPLSHPLDAMLLPMVERWVAVVLRQKTKCGHLDKDGRPWTRLPAKNLVAQLEREQGLVVTVRRVQRSLERLADLGCLARLQRTAWWGQRDFWYSMPDEEWQPTPPPAPSTTETPETVEPRRSETTLVSGQILDSPLPPQTTGLEGSVGPRAEKSKPPAKPMALDPALLEGVRRTAQRAAARGVGAPACPASQSSWIEGGQRYTRLASGHVVIEPLATAFLR